MTSARALRRWPLLAVMMATTVWLAGCPRHVHIERPYPPPPAAALRDMLRARQQEVRTLNGRVRATSWIGGERLKATVLALVERPGRMRLEAEVTLQGTVAVLATDGANFAFLDTRKNELRRGPACPANVASLIRIPLGPSDVAAILLGDARTPDPAPADDDQVSWDGELGADVLDVRRAEGGRLRYAIKQLAGNRPQIAAVTAVDSAGAPVWRVSFEDFVDVPPTSSKPAPPLSLPGTIRFAEGNASFDDGVEIHFKDRTLNDPSAPTAFTLTPPPGTTVIEVGCP
jgi:hypothetical protein